MLTSKDQRNYQCKRAVSPDFAIILEKVLGTTAELWVRIQAEYDLWVARQRAA